jgi:glycosyltransferase involved in cell wall biosynthesis
MASPELSVVIPVYCNAETVAPLHARLRAVLEPLRSFEMLFVDDGCPQGSLAALSHLAEQDPQVGVLSLARNRGQQRAILAGLAHARGEWVVVMDADLQDPPEAIPDLVQAAATGARAVFAGRRGSYESAGRLATSRMFKRLLHWMCGVPADAGVFVMLHRSLVQRLLALGGPCPFLVAMIGSTGLPAVSVPVARDPRPVGVSAYSGWDRLRSAMAALTWLALWRMRLIRPDRVYPWTAPVSTRLGARFAAEPGPPCSP